MTMTDPTPDDAVLSEARARRFPWRACDRCDQPDQCKADGRTCADQAQFTTPPASDAAAPARPVTRMEVIREWVGGERYARDYEYCDATFKTQADRVLALFAAAAPKVAICGAAASNDGTVQKPQTGCNKVASEAGANFTIPALSASSSDSASEAGAGCCPTCGDTSPLPECPDCGNPHRKALATDAAGGVVDSPLNTSSVAVSETGFGYTQTDDATGASEAAGLREALESLRDTADNVSDILNTGLLDEAIAKADATLTHPAPSGAAGEVKPFAYFQRNEAWNTWEEVTPEHKDAHDGIVAAYRHPPLSPGEKEDAADVAAIVAGLTKAQRDLVMRKPSHMPQHDAIMLIDAGLAHIYTARGQRYYGFTPLGDAVRAALQQNDEG